MKIIDVIHSPIFYRPSLSVKIFGPGNYHRLGEIKSGKRKLWPSDRRLIKKYFKKHYNIDLTYDKEERYKES